LGAIIRNNNHFFLLFETSAYLIDCKNCKNKCSCKQTYSLLDKYNIVIPKIITNECKLKLIGYSQISKHNVSNFNDLTLNKFGITERKLLLAINKSL